MIETSEDPAEDNVVESIQDNVYSWIHSSVSLLPSSQTVQPIVFLHMMLTPPIAKTGNMSHLHDLSIVYYI